MLQSFWSSVFGDVHRGREIQAFHPCERLPTELMQQVIGYLDVRDLLTLRHVDRLCNAHVIDAPRPDIFGASRLLQAPAKTTSMRLFLAAHTRAKHNLAMGITRRFDLTAPSDSCKAVYLDPMTRQHFVSLTDGSIAAVNGEHRSTLGERILPAYRPGIDGPAVADCRREVLDVKVFETTDESHVVNILSREPHGAIGVWRCRASEPARYIALKVGFDTPAADDAKKHF